MNKNNNNFLKTKEEIQEWLDRYNIDSYSINEDLIVDVYGDVYLADYGLTEIPFKFGHVVNFDCSHNELTSLNFAPKNVFGSFDCSFNKIKTLKGGPEFVKDNFTCAHNDLKCLLHSPLKVGRNFSCAINKITSLIGMTQEIGGIVRLTYNQLTSLKGCPKIIRDDFNCAGNILITLEHVPEEIWGSFDFSSNQLLVIDHFPKTIIDDIKCDKNPYDDSSYNSKTTNEIKKIFKVPYDGEDVDDLINDLIEDSFDEDEDTEDFKTESEVENSTQIAENKEIERELFKWIDSNNVITDRENQSFINSLRGKYLKEHLVIKDESIFDKLKTEFPNFSKVVDFYKSQFRLDSITKETRIPPVLLLGPPGIGKTAFAKKLAEYTDTGFTFIDMASTSASFVLSGNSSSWHGSKHGKAFDAMLKSKTASPIVLLDELEKCVSRERDPKTVLYQLLEEENSKAFIDEYVNFPSNLSKIIYVACANSTDGLSEALLSRFMVFEIDNPTKEQQEIILQNIYKNEVGSSNVFEDNLSDEVINSLLDVSLREAKLKINRAISNTILEVDMAKLKDNDFPKIRINDNLFIEKKVVKKSIGF